MTTNNENGPYWVGTLKRLFYPIFRATPIDGYNSTENRDFPHGRLNHNEKIDFLVGTGHEDPVEAYKQGVRHIQEHSKIGSTSSGYRGEIVEFRGQSWLSKFIHKIAICMVRDNDNEGNYMDTDYRDR